MSCLKCGGTGILINGEQCDCGISETVILPTFMEIPFQYQGVTFNEQLLPKKLPSSYGSYMTKLMRECTRELHLFHRNVLICSPPNSGKTIFAYTVYGILYAKGFIVPELMDIIELRELLINPYLENKSQLEAVKQAPVLIIKIPQDLPNKLPETMSMVIERRVRKGHSTIFLFSGSKEDLIAQDRFGKLQLSIGDGTYNSIEVVSWIVERKEEENK